MQFVNVCCQVTPLPGEPLMEEGEGEGEVPLTWDDAEEDVPVATETTLASSQKNVDSTLGPNEEGTANLFNCCEWYICKAWYN